MQIKRHIYLNSSKDFCDESIKLHSLVATFILDGSTSLHSNAERKNSIYKISCKESTKMDFVFKLLQKGQRELNIGRKCEEANDNKLAI